MADCKSVRWVNVRMEFLTVIIYLRLKIGARFQFKNQFRCSVAIVFNSNRTLEGSPKLLKLEQTIYITI